MVQFFLFLFFLFVVVVVVRAGRGTGLREACVMRWAIMNIMAIEDGLFPLAYVTHTIKYLQQCKFSCSVENTLKQLAKLR